MIKGQCCLAKTFNCTVWLQRSLLFSEVFLVMNGLKKIGGMSRAFKILHLALLLNNIIPEKREKENCELPRKMLTTQSKVHHWLEYDCVVENSHDIASI